jgi:glycosyltransferase involved in cell wall biosynthesis
MGDDRSRHEPRVSVVIPTFNRAQSIKRAIDSVAAQSFRDFEVIVIDDGSTDDSERIVSEAGIPQLRIIRHPHNRGAAAARNTGIGAATGAYIAFLDSDDAWHPDKLARQIAALAAAPRNIKACATGFTSNTSGRILTVRPDTSTTLFRSQILFGCKICPGTTLMIERGAFREIGMFDENLRRLEDWDLLIRFVERFDVLFLPDPLATIYGSSGPAQCVPDNEDPVLHAIQCISAKHSSRLQGRALRKFRSGVLFEIGARMFRKRRLARATGYVIGSLCTYPLRDASSFRSLWRSLKSLARP